eukprot:scaffold224816_cov39-Prasinocladus_malaysianus.AAC.1
MEFKNLNRNIYTIIQRIHVRPFGLRPYDPWTLSLGVAAPQPGSRARLWVPADGGALHASTDRAQWHGSVAGSRGAAGRLQRVCGQQLQPQVRGPGPQ